MRVSVEITQNQNLSPQLIQSMNILQMSALELNEYVEKTALENPVMELPDVAYSTDSIKQEDVQRKLSWLEASDHQNRIYYNQEKSDELVIDPYSSQASAETLNDYLKAQLILNNYTDLEKDILDFLIESLDSNGFFKDDIKSVADYFVVPMETVQKMLKIIQGLDPAGVGAADLKECLLLQMKRRPEHSEITEKVIIYHLEDVAKNHVNEIAEKLGITWNQVIEACEEIKSLNPKPGNSFSDRSQLGYIRPDAVVVKVDGYFEILINEADYPSFTISPYYQDLSKTTEDSETKKYLQQKLSQATWIQGCIKQRAQTLSKVLKCIVEKQQDFFLFGPGHKNPLKLSDIAEEVGIHESTVSRALKGKYLQCSQGVYPMNYFLTGVTGTASTDAGAVTSERAEIYLKKVIDAEDKHKPLSDQAITEELKKYNINISRRTVNKYRTKLGIPDKSGRKIYKL